MMLVVCSVVVGCFEEPPSAATEEAGDDDVEAGDVDMGDADVGAYDACVEVLLAAGSADCSDDLPTSCEYAWCDGDECSSVEFGEVNAGCEALSLAGAPGFAREEVDACLADAAGDEPACTLVNGACNGFPRCSESCDALGFFEACMASRECCELVCGVDSLCS